MRRDRSTKLLVEPPASATGDIAFNLIVFFLVCASVQPDSGRPQTIPRSEKTEVEKQEENVEVSLTRTSASINGTVVREEVFVQRLKNLLVGKPRPEDKIVVLKTKPDVEYQHWINVTSKIEEAGGILTIQREEERTVQVP
ncbi:ExbD/TolR family protein [Lignipirellula cremea]|uniref:Biopolymer transport protein ExbD/TolR n=1 Tax=Lignipirellula cremea TaxID=2528010 RepID=A0A518DM92_9BACT|nr:biopolymer transporter ExbD [Lignipirellula cremea]QDU92955.1 Biopolymer transport protein ExbD/TolR [Lignipirellula cremea]